MNKFLLFDIGGTEIKYSLINQDLNFILKDSFPSKGSLSGKLILDDIINISQKIILSHKVVGIAVSSAGVINPNTGVVLNATDSIKNYIGLNITEYLGQALKLPVSVENDVNCMALAESLLGHAKPYNHINAITVGTGIGGSIVLNKEILHGTSYSAGEFGLMIIDGKHYEDLASMSALIRYAKELISPNISTGVEIFKLYDEKDPNAIIAVDKFYNYLAQGIANIIYMNNPEAFIIGGGITNRVGMLDELIPYLKKNLRAWELSHTKFYIAQFKNDAGMLGAYLNFIGQYPEFK